MAVVKLARMPKVKNTIMQGEKTEFWAGMAFDWFFEYPITRSELNILSLRV